MKATLSERKVVTLISHLLTFLLFWNQLEKTAGSHIKLQEGFYNGIVIGIDGRIDATNCGDIINNIKNAFHNFSIMLHSATKEKVAIGHVSILIPFGWTKASCKLEASDTISSVDASYSYPSSDLQISLDHPLAKTLPWTRQYKPCGQGGDSIIVPESFLLKNESNGGFTSVQQAQILLHEWTKFKYGVFDEFGYIGKNEPFTPCYVTRDNQVQLTSCSSSRLPSVIPDISLCTKDILEKQKERMTPYFATSQTSIMSLPHIEDVNHYCNKSTHNMWAPSKQNSYCSMKSVQEIVDNHADLRQHSSTVEWKSPEIKVIQRTRNMYATAYAFVIDTSDKMKAEYKLRHVKQALAQFLDVVELGTDVQVFLVTDSFNIVSNGWKLQNDDTKSEVLNFIERKENTIYNRTKTLQEPDLVVDTILNKLDQNQWVSWNIVFLIASQFVQDVPLALSKFEQKSHYVSILSFDNSPEWLQWYGIRNTKMVVVLPYCFTTVTSQPCDLLTSSFILDHLVGLLNEQEEKPAVIQKIGQISLPNEVTDTIFSITDNDGFNVNRFFMFLPVDGTPSINYKLFSPTGRECTAGELLKYDHVIKFQGCNLVSGSWRLSIAERNRTKLYLNVFVEYINDPITYPRLIVTPSFGSADVNRLGISSNSSVVPVYVSVKSENDEPVIGAKVSVRIYKENSLSQGGAYTTINLTDDGNYNDGIDQTTNDGVYSAYLRGYSATPAYHLTQIFVSTDTNSAIMKSIEPSNAVLLDARMTNKCCGKFIEPKETMQITPPFKFQRLHYGFKTLEPSQQLRYPPGKIGLITTDGDTETSVAIKFTSVMGDSSGDNVAIHSIQACCVISPSNSAPQEPDCKPDTVNCLNFEAPSAPQTCSLDKQKLVEIFIPDESGPVDWLNCRLQVINENIEHGELSEGILPVNVSFYAGERAEETFSCSKFSIKNKCLPIWIFWVLIGCVALLLILLVLFVCLWFRNSGKSKEPKNYSTQPVKSSPEPSVYYDKQFTSTTPSQLSPKTPKNEPKVVKELFINHAYIQEGDGEIKILTDQGQFLKKQNDTNNNTPQKQIHHQSPRLVSPPRESDNMQVYKPTPLPQPPAKPRPTKPSRITRPREQQRPEILHSNAMLRSDSSFDMNRNTSTFGQPQSQFSTLPIDSRPDPGIVYASIGRNGRLRPIVNQRKEAPSALPSKRVTIDPHYMVPNTGRPGVPTRHREPLPNPEPPHIHSFPSTDTEDDFRAQQQFPVRQLKPPPYPAGSQLLNRTRTPTNSKPTAMHNMGQPASLPAPPVAPPRYDRSNSGGAVQQFTTRQDMSDDDEDSDNWDDGMEFDYNVGISYA